MRELTAAPVLPLMFGRAALGELVGRGRRGASLPAEGYSRARVRVDTGRLADYDRVCGFRLSDTLPATFPHLLTFPLATKLMTDPGFPFGLVGLVHVANTITVHRPLRVTDVLDLAVHAANLREHPRGRQFDVVSRVYVGGEPAWSETSTYLRRSGGSGNSGESGERRPDPAEPPAPNARWRVPGDIGRRYAAVSGDVNPIHLHPLSARVLGFRRAIAHGMWTKARCLAALEGRLPAAYTVEVRFQLPVLVPATVAFSESAAGDGFTFALHDARSGKPHLQGTVT